MGDRRVPRRPSRPWASVTCHGVRCVSGRPRVPERPSRPWASVASLSVPVASLGVRRVPGCPSRPCLAPWVRATVPSSVMAPRWFWRWRVQRLFGLLLARLQAGPLLLRCGHLRGCVVRGPLHRCAVDWSTCEAFNSRDTALTAAMRVRGGSNARVWCCCLVLLFWRRCGTRSLHWNSARPRCPRHDGGSQGAGPIVCGEGALLPKARVCRAGASVAARSPVEKSLLGAETRVLSVRIPLRLMRSNSWVLTCS